MNRVKIDDIVIGECKATTRYTLIGHITKVE